MHWEGANAREKLSDTGPEGIKALELLCPLPCMVRRVSFLLTNLSKKLVDHFAVVSDLLPPPFRFHD